MKDSFMLLIKYPYSIAYNLVNTVDSIQDESQL